MAKAKSTGPTLDAWMRNVGRYREAELVELVSVAIKTPPIDDRELIALAGSLSRAARKLVAEENGGSEWDEQ